MRAWSLGARARRVFTRMPCRQRLWEYGRGGRIQSERVKTTLKQQRMSTFTIKVNTHARLHWTPRKEPFIKRKQKCFATNKTWKISKTKTGYTDWRNWWILWKLIVFFFFFRLSVGLTKRDRLNWSRAVHLLCLILRLQLYFKDLWRLWCLGHICLFPPRGGEGKKGKKLFIILPITQHCLSSVIKQREHSQSKFAFFRSEWTHQAMEGMHFNRVFWEAVYTGTPQRSREETTLQPGFCCDQRLGGWAGFTPSLESPRSSLDALEGLKMPNGIDRFCEKWWLL